MEGAAAHSALSNLFSKLLQEVDSPRLPKSKGKKEGYSTACVSSSFFLAASTKSRLRPAGFQQAGHVSLVEAPSLSSVAWFRRKAVLLQACVSGSPPALNPGLNDGEAATGEPSQCFGKAASRKSRTFVCSFFFMTFNTEYLKKKNLEQLSFHSVFKEGSGKGKH